MNTKDKDERIELLRQDPDFKALVKALESQNQEQVEAFYSHYEHDEDKGVEDDAQLPNGEEVHGPDGRTGKD